MRKKKGPWIVTGTRVVYQNPWVKVTEDKVIRPDKKKGIFGFIEQTGGVSVIPLDAKGNVYLTKEYHYAVGRVTVEAVSGGTDKGENKLQAAKRELKEETGLIAKKWTYLGVVDPLTTVLSSPNHLYLAEGLTQTDPDPEGTETIQVIKIPFRKALKWVMESKITHAGTAVALLKIKYFLNK